MKIPRRVIRKEKIKQGYRYLMECNYCHKTFYILGERYNNGKGKFCNLKCFGSYNTGKNNPKWKGGRPKYVPTTWPRKSCNVGRNNPMWTGGKPKCKECGTLLKNYSSKICKKCRDKSIMGDNHPNWNGGKYTTKYGYINILCYHKNSNKNGYMKEHRLIAEKILGRLLLKTEVVHHINGTPNDNRP